MKLSDKTLSLKKRQYIFFGASTALWVGTFVFYFFAALSFVSASKTPSGIGALLSDQAKQLLISISATAVIGIILSIVIKDKVRTAIWMASVIIGTTIYGEAAMYITLALWAIDEYALFANYKRIKNRYIINKEIDDRLAA